MGNIEGAINLTLEAINRWRVEKTSNQHRPHLGASQIGHPCERHLWYVFHWCESQKFDGRMLRLFETGQLAEARFVEELRGIGCTVHDVDSDGRQFSVSAIGGHFSGSMDGCAKGIPEAPQTWHNLEFKTHSAKSFADLKKRGVLASKPTHYAQMQVYMALTGMTRSLYLAVNKDTDELYAERIREDKTAQKALLEKAERVIASNEPPSRISNDPSWYECKFCNFHSICHETQAPEVNCRTCAHSTAELSGGWSCARSASAKIPIEFQRTGCDQHRYIPVLLAGFTQVEDASDEQNWISYTNQINKQVFVNGDPSQGHYSSHEIRACGSKAALGDAVVNEFRATFSGRIDG
jgi:ribosomal protein S27E